MLLIFNVLKINTNARARSNTHTHKKAKEQKGKTKQNKNKINRYKKTHTATLKQERFDSKINDWAS